MSSKDVKAASSDDGDFAKLVPDQLLPSHDTDEGASSFSGKKKDASGKAEESKVDQDHPMAATIAAEGLKVAASASNQGVSAAVRSWRLAASTGYYSHKPIEPRSTTQPGAFHVNGPGNEDSVDETVTIETTANDGVVQQHSPNKEEGLISAFMVEEPDAAYYLQGRGDFGTRAASETAAADPESVDHCLCLGGHYCCSRCGYRCIDQQEKSGRWCSD